MEPLGDAGSRQVPDSEILDSRFGLERFGLERGGIWLPAASGGLPGAPGGHELFAKSSEGAHAPRAPLVSTHNHPWGCPKHSTALRSR